MLEPTTILVHIMHAIQPRVYISVSSNFYQHLRAMARALPLVSIHLHYPRQTYKYYLTTVYFIKEVVKINPTDDRVKAATTPYKLL
jgi:hypothetical protein